MWRRCALVLVVLLAPGVARAQEKLDNLLPAGSQVYLRWDGVTAHKADAEKLAVMKMWKGETGAFLRGVWHYIEDIGKEALTKEIGAELAGAVFEEFGGLFKSVTNNGFTLGVELQGVDPFKMQLTMGFPHGGGKAKSPLSFLNTVARIDKEAKVKTIKHGKRTVHFVHFEPIYLAWWAEGKDAIWSFGTTEPGALLKDLENRKENLSSNPVYKDVDGFKEFPAWMRGYVDVPAIIKAAGRGQPVVNQITDALGLDTIKSITFYSGFDGPAERAVSFTNLAKGPRKGIMKLFSDKKFSLKDLPPMPADLDHFSASAVHMTAAYEVGVDFAATLVNLVAPFGAPDIKQAIKDFEQNNKVSITGTLNHLEPLLVTYAAPAEGFLGFGQTMLFKVKDEKKLAQDLGRLLDLAKNQAGGMATVSLEQKGYHGATIHRLGIGEPNTGIEFTKWYYTIYKGWLGISQYPQPLMGYILRAKGDLPAWKVNEELQAKLKPFPTEFTAINVSDPRPTVQTILAILPPIVDFGSMALQQAAAFGGGPKLPIKKFDLTLIPNAYEATKHLFPNVTISTVDGDTLRSETRSSLMLGF
jgi:hypothetical protein